MFISHTVFSKHNLNKVWLKFQCVHESKPMYPCKQNKISFSLKLISWELPGGSMCHLSFKLFAVVCQGVLTPDSCLKTFSVYWQEADGRWYIRSARLMCSASCNACEHGYMFLYYCLNVADMYSHHSLAFGYGISCFTNLPMLYLYILSSEL